MNEAVLETMERALEGRIAGGEMFTAWDITRQVRAESGARVPHGLVRQVVHQCFFAGGMGADYTRTLCHVGGDHGPAWVYHRQTDHPEEYTTDAMLERLMGLRGE
jgi:hypothetical protein